MATSCIVLLEFVSLSSETLNVFCILFQPLLSNLTIIGRIKLIALSLPLLSFVQMACHCLWISHLLEFNSIQLYSSGSHLWSIPVAGALQLQILKDGVPVGQMVNGWVKKACWFSRFFLVTEGEQVPDTLKLSQNQIQQKDQPAS
jgi:hypothetical protein